MVFYIRCAPITNLQPAMGVFLLVLSGFQLGFCCLPPPPPSTNSPTPIISGCEEEQSDTCQTINGIKCVFPFINGSTKYTSCADYNGLYTWCATSLKEDCSYDNWGKCDDTDCGTVPE